MHYNHRVDGMRQSLKVVVLLAAFALQPLALCFSTEMTPSEEQCCSEMAGACGQASTPTSHSCCTYVDRPESARPEAKNTQISSAVWDIAPPAMQDGTLGLSPLLLLEAAAESPPQSPSSSVQVLRI